MIKKEKEPPCTDGIYLDTWGKIAIARLEFKTLETYKILYSRNLNMDMSKSAMVSNDT